MSSLSPANASRKRHFRDAIDFPNSTQGKRSTDGHGTSVTRDQSVVSHLQHPATDIDSAEGGPSLHHDDSHIRRDVAQEEGPSQIHATPVTSEQSVDEDQHESSPDINPAPGNALLHDDDPQVDWRTTQTQCGLAEQDNEDDLILQTPSAPRSRYQIPQTILDAQESLRTRATQLAPVYSAFLKQLCQGTATQCVEASVYSGVQYAISKAKSFTLDQKLYGEPLMYAFALIVHVWQVANQRSQHGAYPNTTESLALQWASYFHAAVAIIWTHFGSETKPSVSRFRFAVQYWEARLVEIGGARVWDRAQWLRAIVEPDLDSPSPHDETAEEYLRALQLTGKIGLTTRVLEKEIDGPPTVLRTHVDASNIKEKKWVHSEIFGIFNAMDMDLLKALIEGQLPRKAEIPFYPVWTALERVNRPEITRPSIYMNSICDRMGISPTPAQWQSVCKHMDLYVTSDGNDLSAKVDQLIHPSSNWPVELARRNLRRYTEWRSWLNNEDSHPDANHRNMVQYFASEMRKRIEGLARHVPLNAPVIEIGYSLNSHERLRQHARHRNSNYLMNLSEALFEHLYPGSFRLQQRIIYNCYRKEQTWLGEIVLTQLGQGYTEGARGFSHHPAGNSNGSAYRETSAQEWDAYEAETCSEGDGRMMKEIEMEIEWAKKRNEEKELASRKEKEKLELQKQKLLRLKDLVEAMTRLVEALP